MTRYVIELDTDNDAFQDGQLTAEIASILRGILSDLERDWHPHKNGAGQQLRDSNGNAAGRVMFFDDPA